VKLKYEPNHLAAFLRRNLKPREAPMPIAVIGAGGVGGTFGAALAQTSADVALWPVGHPRGHAGEGVEDRRRKGRHIFSLDSRRWRVSRLRDTALLETQTRARMMPGTGRPALGHGLRTDRLIRRLRTWFYIYPRNALSRLSGIDALHPEMDW
jgi:hypothetical protein